MGPPISWKLLLRFSLLNILPFGHLLPEAYPVPITNSVIEGEGLMCDCDRARIRLTGYSRAHGCSWTPLQALIPGGAQSLSGYRGMCKSLKLPERRVLLDAAAPSRSCRRRIYPRTPAPDNVVIGGPALIWRWSTLCSRQLGY